MLNTIAMGNVLVNENTVFFYSVLQHGYMST